MRALVIRSHDRRSQSIRRVPFQASTGYGLDFTGPILVWMLLLLPGVAYFAAFFHSTATNRIYPVWKPRQMRR